MRVATINSIVNDFKRHARYAFEDQKSRNPMEACYHDGVLAGMVMVLRELGEDDITASILADTLRKIRADKEQAQREQAEKELLS